MNFLIGLEVVSQDLPGLLGLVSEFRSLLHSKGHRVTTKETASVTVAKAPLPAPEETETTDQEITDPLGDAHD